MPDNVFLNCYYSIHKSELEADMKVTTQIVTQEPFFSELSEGGDIKNLISSSCFCKCYHEFQNLTT